VIEVIEAARIERDHWGPGAHSPNHEIAQSLSAAAAAAPLAPLVGVADSHERERQLSGQTRTPRDQGEADSRRCLDEQVSPLVLSQSQLACRRGLSGIPHMTLHSRPRVHRWRLSPLAVCPSFSLFPWFWPRVPVVTFHPHQRTHCASCMRHGLRMRHCICLTGLRRPSAHSRPVRFPRRRATGGAGSAKAQREVVLRL
jgi:hypothetical protein